MRGPLSSKIEYGAQLRASKPLSSSDPPPMAFPPPPVSISMLRTSAPVPSPLHCLLQVPASRPPAGAVMSYGVHIREHLHAGESFRYCTGLTASDPSPAAFLCLLLVYCKPPFNILCPVVHLAPGPRFFSVFLLPPSLLPSLPAFAGLTLTRGTFLQRHIKCRS